MSPTMSKKSDETEPENQRAKRNRRTAPVQIDRELARRAAVVATHMGITQSELLSPRLAQFINTMYRKVVSEMGDEAQELDDQE